MRKLIPVQLERGRIRSGHWGSDSSYGNTGSFIVMSPHGIELRILSSGAHAEDEGWEHVSVSAQGRCPTLEEMCFVKDLFWNKEECVVQYHPAKSQYVNCHPHTLHLWKCKTAEFPVPPTWMVGPK